MWILITLGILCLAYGVSLGVRHRHKKLGWTFLALSLALTIFFAGGTAWFWNPPRTEEEKPDYGLALGCGLENGQATPEMIVRCHSALQWMQENKRVPLIVSGGDPGEQGRTEAAVMAAWLRNHGADADYILIEDQANDTRENILLSKELAEENGLGTEQVTIITSDYHQTRAKFLAEREGQQVSCRSAETPILPHLAGAVREVYCMVSELLGL